MVKDRKIYGRKLEETLLELEQSRHLGSIGRSASQVCHEIRNYLFPIAASVRSLRRQRNDELGVGEKLDSIDRSVRQISEFTGDVLGFARARSGDAFQIVTFQEFLPEVVQQHFSPAAEQIHIETPAEFRVSCIPQKVEHPGRK